MLFWFKNKILDFKIDIIRYIDTTGNSEILQTDFSGHETTSIVSRMFEMYDLTINFDSFRFTV